MNLGDLGAFADFWGFVCAFFVCTPSHGYAREGGAEDQAVCGDLKEEGNYYGTYLYKGL